jgi:sugar/nucleoside kinase (ribokinase family)
MFIAKAAIFSLPDGSNSVVSECRASNAFDKNISKLYDDWEAAIKQCDVLMLQNETPEVNLLASKIAKEHGKLIHLDVGGRTDPL